MSQVSTRQGVRQVPDSMRGVIDEEIIDESRISEKEYMKSENALRAVSAPEDLNAADAANRLSTGNEDDEDIAAFEALSREAESDLPTRLPTREDTSTSYRNGKKPPATSSALDSPPLDSDEGRFAAPEEDEEIRQTVADTHLPWSRVEDEHGYADEAKRQRTLGQQAANRKFTDATIYAQTAFWGAC